MLIKQLYVIYYFVSHAFIKIRGHFVSFVCLSVCLDLSIVISQILKHLDSFGVVTYNNVMHSIVGILYEKR